MDGRVTATQGAQPAALKKAAAAPAPAAGAQQGPQPGLAAAAAAAAVAPPVSLAQLNISQVFTLAQKKDANEFFSTAYSMSAVANELFQSALTGGLLKEILSVPDSIKDSLRSFALEVAQLDTQLSNDEARAQAIALHISKSVPKSIPQEVLSGARTFAPSGYIFRGTGLRGTEAKSALDILAERVDHVKDAFSKTKPGTVRLGSGAGAAEASLSDSEA